MVNKGFKNEGSDVILKRTKNAQYTMPIGISIGMTNQKFASVDDAIADIILAVKKTEKSNNNFSYYELNISCPNLLTNISFYSLPNLKKLLGKIQLLRLTRPIFVKMPIEKSDNETKELLSVIAKFSPVGVIFGNLQKDRTLPIFDQKELAKYPKGNFSGKPTWQRSNELISLAYKLYKSRFIIIGCGGILVRKMPMRK